MIIIRIKNRILRDFKENINTVVNKLSLYLHEVKIGKNYKINGQIYFSNYGSIAIGDDFQANSGRDYNPIGGDTILRIIVRKNAIVHIGNNVGISNSTIYAEREVIIGNNVMIGGGCKIWDTDFHSIDPIIRTSGNDTDKKVRPINICDYAFIGSGSIILKGVRIGRNAVIGAGSVVSKDIPDDEIWGGNPARLIRKLK